MTVRPNKRIWSPLIGALLLILSIGASAWTVRAYLESRELDENPGLGLHGGEATGTPEAVAGTPAEGGGFATPDARFAEMSLSAQSVLLMNARTGEMIYEKNPDDPRATASTIKMVTALTVLRHAGPEEIVTILPEDTVDPVEESNMSLQAGDIITVHDLLVGLLLPSGNDAANALARIVGARLPGDGTPIERFLAEMNVTALIVGMTNSHFVNASGDDGEGQVSTARDLALAARTLLAEPALYPIVALRHAEVRVGGPQARVILLSNTNEMLPTEGVYGVKTGTTPVASQCLVLAYRRSGLDEIAVILGSQDRYQDARTLLGLPELPPALTPTPEPPAS